MTREGHGKAPSIENEKEVSWADKNSAKIFKGEAERDQRVLEATRAEADDESIVEMVLQMDQQLDRLIKFFKASMAEFDKRLAKATEIAAEQDSGGSPTAAISATAMATLMQLRRQIEERIAKKAMMRMRVKAQVKGLSLKKAESSFDGHGNGSGTWCTYYL